MDVMLAVSNLVPSKARIGFHTVAEELGQVGSISGLNAELRFCLLSEEWGTGCYN